MTEEEYIKATNLSKARGILYFLNSMVVGYGYSGITNIEYQNICNDIEAIIKRLSILVDLK